MGVGDLGDLLGGVRVLLFSFLYHLVYYIIDR